MIPPIVVRFATAGIPEVSAAFARVDAQARKFEEGMATTAARGSRARVGVADKEARDKLKAEEKVAKEAARAEQERTKLAEKEAKRRENIVRRSSEMAGAEAVKAARAEAKEIERIEDQKMRMRIRSSETAARAAAREVAEEERLRIRAAETSARAAARGAAEEVKAREKVASAAGGYGKTWGSRIGGAASMLGATAGIGGAFAAISAGRAEFADERSAAQLVNLVTSGTKAPDGANVKNIIGQAGAVSRETGMDRSEIIEATKTYAKNAQHGDFAGAMGNMGFFAKLSKVSGADMGDIAQAAGTLQSQNPDLDPAQMKQMLLDANEMSKQGKMSFSESLAQMGKVGSTRSSYGGNVADNQRTLIGLAQIAKSGGTAEEVGTFTSALAAESTEANKKFKKTHGKELFKTDQFGRIASPDSLVADVLRNTGGNIQEINGLMGRRGGALFREVEQSYIQGAGKKNDVEAGIKSVQAYMGQVTSARGSEEGLDAQFKQSMDQPGEKFANTINRLEEELKERLAPALEVLADKLSDPKVEAAIDEVIGAFSKVADYLIKNPLAGIGQIIALAVTKDIAAAAIGNSVKALLMSMLSKGGGGIGGAGEGLGVLGKVGAAVGIAAGATAISIAGMDAIDAYGDHSRSEASRSSMSGAQGSADAMALARKAKDGKVTPADIAKATAAAEAQSKIVAEKQAAMESGPGVFAKMTGVSAEVAADQKAQYTLQKAALDEMIRSIKAASTALAGMKGNTPNAVQPVTSGAPAAPIGSTARG